MDCYRVYIKNVKSFEFKAVNLNCLKELKLNIDWARTLDVVLKDKLFSSREVRIIIDVLVVYRTQKQDALLSL